MTAVFRTLSQDTRIQYLFFAVGVAFVIVAIGVFVLDIEGATPDPVSFDQTTSTGVAGEDRREIMARGLDIPRAQVFYSQYRYVIGYRGISHAVNSFQQPGHESQFGYPITVYVSDYTDVEITLTEEGYINATGEPGWTSAEDAHFVLESEAAVPTGETTVPFSSEAAAEAFVAEYGGEISDWSAVQDYDFQIAGAEVVRERVVDQHDRADERIATTRPLAEREGSTITVGEDEPTIQAAIDAADEGSTVLVPEGTYEESIEIDRPVTVRGENATIDGGGNGTVIEITHDDVAVVGLDIVGVGEETDPPEDAVGDDWDERIEAGYGHGDAGISAVEVSDVYIADLSIDTPTNGVLLRDANHTAVERIQVNGTERWQDGFMGVLAMRSPTVVQNSTMIGGRDGVYYHRSPETVVRNNTFRENRFGVHVMYSSDALIADNVARGQTIAGITIMTDPARNAVVGNDVRNATSGILPAGSRSYFADNVLAFNDRGMSISAGQSLYERNVIYGNDIGVRSSALRPTNRVTENDFVANEQTVETGAGPLRIWTYDGIGNYWDGAAAHPVEVPATYSPTDPTNQFHQIDGAATLAASPAATTMAALQGMTPGLRDGAVIDTAPRTEPVHPEIVRQLAGEQDE